MDTCGREQILEIYALNDVHGRFFNTPHYESGERCSLANACTFIKGRRAVLGPDRVVLLDCGDNLQGDMAVCRSNRRLREGDSGHIYSKAAGYLGYDAVVFGNHDFEAGHNVYDRLAAELADAGVPLLGANVVSRETGECCYPPYVILQRGGAKIAVIGMTNPCTARWIPQYLREGIEFAPVLPLAGELVGKIRANGEADVIVMLLHSGAGEEDAFLSESGPEHQALAVAAQLDGVDVIFAGHDHKQMCCRVSQTLVLSGAPYAETLQKAVVRLEMEGGKIVGKKMEGEIVQLGGVGADKGYLEHFRDEIRAVEEEISRPVGELEAVMDARGALGGRCSYLDLQHSVMLEASGAQVSFASPYMYDAVIPAGEVTGRDLFQMYSAENTLFKVRMTGRQIRDYLEYSYGMWISAPGDGEHVLQLCSTELGGKTFWWPENFTYNFDSAAGLVYEVDITREYGSRVRILSLWNGEPFEPEGNYTVALSSYRVSGGGGLFDHGAGIDPATALEGITLDRYTFIRDLIGDFIRDGKRIDAARCGHWKFVPKEKAAQGIGSDVRLLFGETP